ncbi:hypothetical protein ACFQPA_01975 [Halomarina halobia]|uniref:DUF2064 domain-containing protein n=1 Tax=Halomarina halobia TaxID=3033386 RepID=A0ABD6A4P7_9EURY|nr:hypothetical protein [Halomarina sp. PSR21]
MTTVAVLCDPPRPGLVLSSLVETSPLTAEEVSDLYAAMLGDVVRAVESSGGELLVNYRPDESLPGSFADGEASAEAEVRAVVRGALKRPDEARFEVQVGQTFAGRAGNTATHLLDREGVTTVAVVEPSAAFLARSHVDNAAMKLRRSEVVLGPTTRGRVYYAGFAGTIDYADAYASPAIETLTDRALDVGHEVDYLPMLPVIETGEDLADALTLLRARQRAGRIVPERTTAALDETGLTVVADDEPRLER